jgi:anti-anti-sigma regulatory factor
MNTPNIIANVSVFQPMGELDCADGGLLLDKIRDTLHSDFNRVVLDLGEVHHIHYRLVTELLELSVIASEISQEPVGGLKLANVHPQAQQILKFAGVEGYFETYESVGEAVLSFQDLLLEGASLQ